MDCDFRLVFFRSCTWVHDFNESHAYRKISKESKWTLKREEAGRYCSPFCQLDNSVVEKWTLSPSTKPPCAWAARRATKKQFSSAARCCLNKDLTKWPRHLYMEHICTFQTHHFKWTATNLPFIMQNTDCYFYLLTYIFSRKYVSLQCFMWLFTADELEKKQY